MVAKKVRNVGTIVVRGRERKLYEGSKGGIFYRSKGAKVYVDKKVLRQSSHKKKKVITKKKTKFGNLFDEIRKHRAEQRAAAAAAPKKHFLRRAQEKASFAIANQLEKRLAPRNSPVVGQWRRPPVKYVANL